MLKSPARERSERAHAALFVIVLTFACTAMACYDMFQLALGF